MATLGKFTGQFPQISEFGTGEKNIAALYHLESSGAAAVGDALSLQAGSPNNLHHNNYGVFGKYAYFNGAAESNESSYYRTSSTAWNWVGTGKTWMFWCKYDSAPGWNATALSHNKDNATTNWRFDAPSGNFAQIRVYFYKTDDSVSIAMTSNTNYVSMNDGKKHCVAWVEESASSHKLYVDGVLHDSSTTNITSVSTGGRVHVGADAYSGGVKSFDGWIDEVAIFNKAWTAKEMYAFGGGLLI